MNIPSDQRALLAAAVVAIAVPVIFPKAAWFPILVGAVVASILVVLFGFSLSSEETKDETGASARAKEGKRRLKDEDGFAPIDPTLYTLRMPFGPEGTSKLRHLSLRKGGRLLVEVKRAVRLGSRNGNTGSGARALVALEDFFGRYHRALASKDPDLAARTLGILRDTRVVALNAIEDIAFTVPIALSKPVRDASEAVRSETLECMATLALKHAPSLSPQLDATASACSAPLPIDPSGRIGEPHSLF